MAYISGAPIDRGTGHHLNQYHRIYSSIHAWCVFNELKTWYYSKLRMFIYHAKQIQVLNHLHHLSRCHTLPRSHGVGTALWNFSEPLSDCTNMLENKTNNFTFSKPWGCYGTPHSDRGVSEERPRRATAFPLSPGRRLTAWSRSTHDVPAVCKEFSLRIDGVHTAHTARPVRFYGVCTECVRTPQKKRTRHSA